MIVRILLYFVIALAIAFVIFWFLTGGPAAAWREIQTLTNPFSVLFLGGTSTGQYIRLPWQPETTTHGPDIYGFASEAAQSGTETADELDAQYDALREDLIEAMNFGDPSPYADRVVLSGEEGAKLYDPRTEYVALRAEFGNTAPIDMTGWSLQSALTGVRAFLPQAASPFIMGAINETRGVSLEPGGSAVVVSGQSPSGLSFRENICTGYLEQLQEFTPTLSSSCPTPSELLPLTPENLRTYGDTCFDYVRDLPACYFPPSASLPPGLSPACRDFIVTNFTYNGCVANYRARASFALDSWRLYLGSPGELWRNSHDIIRLLDRDGRTVDVLTY
jgi:hypothetical protein